MLIVTLVYEQSRHGEYSVYSIQLEQNGIRVDFKVDASKNVPSRFSIYIEQKSSSDQLKHRKLNRHRKRLYVDKSTFWVRGCLLLSYGQSSTSGNVSEVHMR